MTSFADVLPDGSLAIRQSRTSLGKKRPSVVGATIYNHRHAYSSKTEDSYSSIRHRYIQGAVNGPVSELSNPKGSTVEYANAVVPQQDAIHRCPALIILKEENNNNNLLYLLYLLLGHYVW